MKKTNILLALALLVSTVAFSQVGIGTTTPDASAMLDIDATDKGFLPPRLTTAQRNAIPSPVAGLTIFNTTTNSTEFSNGTEWVRVADNFTEAITNTTAPTGPGGVSIGVASPDANAALDVTSTTKGLLLPRTTTGSITSPTEGLTIYDTSNNCVNVYQCGKWINLCEDPCDGEKTVDVGGETYNTVVSCGQCWLDRNLGASRVATSRTDADSFGDLYQWGRAADGHEKRNSTLHDGTSIRPNTITDSGIWDGEFITIPANVNRNDWVTTQTNNAWNAGTLAIPIKTTTDPCPSGYRVPTIAELNSERLSWSTNDAAGAFASPLKLPTSGVRTSTTGSVNVGISAAYWSSTVNGASTDAAAITYNTNANSGNVSNIRRATGNSVRCLKD